MTLRIRSIKPEFWRSPDIAQLGVFTRLLFIGLWSYVDDHGNAPADTALIAADLFPHDLSRDPHAVLTECSRSTQELENAGLIGRYEVRKRCYLHIISFDKHQKFNRRSDPKYPGPDEGEWLVEAGLTEGAVRTHAQLTEGSLPEQGTGNREQGTGTAPTGASDRAAEQEFEDWWTHYPKKVDKGQARKAFKAALKKTDLDTLTEGAKRYAASVASSEPRFIKNPATWLNAEAWDNEDQPTAGEPPRPPKHDPQGRGPEEYRFYEEHPLVIDARRQGVDPPPVTEFIAWPGDPANDQHLRGPERRPLFHVG